jgi:MFS family permease
MNTSLNTANRSIPTVIFALAACMALQMTSFAIILPIFPLRFEQMGAGVQALGLSTMAYAISNTLASPYMGGLSDRWSRRKVLLVALLVYVLAFLGYLLAPTVIIFITLRGVAGIFTAGLIPAVMGIIADKTPAIQRGRYIGIVNGGGAIGWIIGPLIGGALNDNWGIPAAFICSISIAAITWIIALITIPETRPDLPDPTPIPPSKDSISQQPGLISRMVHSFHGLPQPLAPFVVLMLVSFAVFISWAFIEPEFFFYAYNGLGWSSSQLGLVMSTYGVAMMLGEFGLGHLSDRFGRTPVLVIGLLFFSMQYIGLVFFSGFAWITLFFILAGLGNALFDPALNAYLLDITPPSQEGRVMGLKNTAGSFGNVLGPALIVLASSHLPSRMIFLCSAVLIILITLISLVILNQKKRPISEVSEVSL